MLLWNYVTHPLESNWLQKQKPPDWPMVYSVFYTFEIGNKNESFFNLELWEHAVMVQPFSTQYTDAETAKRCQREAKTMKWAQKWPKFFLDARY